MIWDILEDDNSFNARFSSPNLTIEELLLDDNILTELQNLNPLLITL